MIKIINRLQLSDMGLMVKGTKQEVHLQQGAMDGACAVYSMMMSLIIARAIHRNEVVNLNDEKIKGNTSKGRLIRNFLYNNGFVRNGYELNDLNDELLHSFQKIIHTDYYSIGQDGDDFIPNILKALDNNNPVELTFQRKGKSGHAVVAIGYTMKDDMLRLYCLDPSVSLSWFSLWNNVIDVNMNKNDERCSDYNHLTESKVDVNGILLIEENNDLDSPLPF